MRNPWTSGAAIVAAIGGVIIVLGRGFGEGDWDAQALGEAIMAVAIALGLSSAKDAPPAP